jgi:hypothetical protein
MWSSSSMHVLSQYEYQNARFNNIATFAILHAQTVSKHMFVNSLYIEFHVQLPKS